MVKPMFAPILAMIGGFVLAFGMFVGGLLFAVFFFFDNEPAHAPVQTASISELWAAEPRAVKTDAQELERVAPKADRTNAGEPAVAVEGQAQLAEPVIDRMTTGAVPAVADEPTADEPADNPAAARLLQAHQDWCARRYRSYDARTNSYSPYAGGRRDCFSPYAAEYAALTGAETPSDPNVRFAPLADEEPSGVIEAAAAEGDTFAVEQDGFVVEDANGYAVIDDQHVRNCFSRYQSYRPEDNTYQPYGGGPRRQCE